MSTYPCQPDSNHEGQFDASGTNWPLLPAVYAQWRQRLSSRKERYNVDFVQLSRARRREGAGPEHQRPVEPAGGDDNMSVHSDSSDDSSVGFPNEAGEEHFFLESKMRSHVISHVYGRYIGQCVYFLPQHASVKTARSYCFF